MNTIILLLLIIGMFCFFGLACQEILKLNPPTWKIFKIFSFLILFFICASVSYNELGSRGITHDGFNPNDYWFQTEATIKTRDGIEVKRDTIYKIIKKKNNEK